MVSGRSQREFQVVEHKYAQREKHSSAPICDRLQGGVAKTPLPKGSGNNAFYSAFVVTGARVSASQVTGMLT
jgi:hypothetical protein